MERRPTLAPPTRRDESALLSRAPGAPAGTLAAERRMTMLAPEGSAMLHLRKVDDATPEAGRHAPAPPSHARA
jgi:hypothetical protein